MKTNHRLNKWIIFLAAVLLFSSGLTMNICAAESAAKTKVITVIGESQMGKDITGARDSAISSCLLIAIQNAAIESLPLPLLTEKFQSLSSLLASRKDEFIVDYKVLQEIKADKQYRVLAQATVSLDKLQQALAVAGIVSTVEKMPQVLFLIAERNAGDPAWIYWWQKEKPASEEASVSAMKEILKAKGFPVIDPQFVPGDFFNDMQLTADLSDDAAIDLGKRLFADVVIVGAATADETSNRMGDNLRSIKGTINVRGILTETGEKIEPVQVNAIAAGGDAMAGSRQALTEAGRQAGDILAPRMIAKWQEIQKPTGEITLNIKGKNIMSHLMEFRNVLKNTPGVTNQRILEIAPEKAVVSVSYQGPPKSLADALLVQAYAGFGVNIFEVTSREINIELTSK